MKEVPNKMKGVSILADHVLVLILCCLTAHSICSCKCVCHSKNHLISDTEYQKELPQIVVTFTYHT
jgi:hypothetical protein